MATINQDETYLQALHPFLDRKDREGGAPGAGGGVDVTSSEMVPGAISTDGAGRYISCLHQCSGADHAVV
ncbi:hypothetical protein ANO11243_084580 [Dothideomycetidae sp. 11243]|nr:hypothetical protein ANO11243_084580 [fungal sp. No.11243]